MWQEQEQASQRQTAWYEVDRIDREKQRVKRQGEADRKEQSVVGNKNDVGGRETVTKDEERSGARTLNRDGVMQTCRLSGCEDVVSQ